MLISYKLMALLEDFLYVLPYEVMDIHVDNVLGCGTVDIG
jgi:hypothetical protein